MPKYVADVTPATPKQMERLRQEEAARKRFDPGYVDAKTAGEIPKEVLATDPALRARVEWSSQHWPERRQSMAEATRSMGDLPGGTGEVVQRREVRLDGGSGE